MSVPAPTREAVDAALAPLGAFAAPLIAVSGGPDSTALLALAADWAARRGGARLYAATVDHALRPESAGEAQAVAALCARFGVPHETLIWQGDKPATGLQARAREARYALLVAHARAIGADALVTAHHLDDQAETVLLRLTRGSGVAGLAGMAPRSERDGLPLLRPILGFPKAALIACCDAAGLAYARDPSNANPRFARPRWRALRETLANEGLTPEALARLARRVAHIEAALARQCASAEARLGLIAHRRCDALEFAAEPVEIAQRLLTAAVAATGGREESRIGLEKMEAATAALRAAIAARARFSANVGGALIVHDGEAAVSVAPEPRRRRL